MNEPASEPTSFRRVAQRVSLLAGALVFAVVCGGVSAADTAAAGDFSRSVVVDGVKRHYLVHVPPAERSNAPVPVVLLLHGGYGSAVGVTRVTGGFQALADRAGFIAVYPDAKGNHWDDGRETLMSRTNDVAFIAVLLDTLAAEHRIDAQRVYAVGICRRRRRPHSGPAPTGSRRARRRVRCPMPTLAMEPPPTCCPSAPAKWRSTASTKVATPGRAARSTCRHASSAGWAATSVRTN